MTAPLVSHDIRTEVSEFLASPRKNGRRSHYILHMMVGYLSRIIFENVMHPIIMQNICDPTSVLID